jgi:DNA-binding MarR family transcriptional regulator
LAVRALVVATEQYRARRGRTRLAISPTEMTALGTLHVDGPHTISELARILAMTPASATELADRLEHAGLVERRPHPTDRRKRLLHSTPAATATLADIYQEMGELFVPAAADLPRAALLNFLTAAAGALRSATPADDDSVSPTNTAPAKLDRTSSTAAEA